MPVPETEAMDALAPPAHPGFLAAREVAGVVPPIGAVVAEFVAGAVGQGVGLVSRIRESSFRDETPRMIADLLPVSLLAIVIGLITGRPSKPVFVHRHEAEWKTEG